MEPCAKKSGSLSFTRVELLQIFSSLAEKKASVRVRAVGFSMSPFIKDGDIITIAPLSGAATKPGMIVAFACEEREGLVVHRIISRCNGRRITKGDNSISADPAIDDNNILGFVKKIERKGKNVFLGLGVSGLFIAMLSRAGALILLYKAKVILSRIVNIGHVRPLSKP